MLTPNKACPILIEFADSRACYPLSGTPMARHEPELLRAAYAMVSLPRQPGESEDDHMVRREVAREDRFLALCSQKIGSAPFDSVLISDDCVIVASFLRRIDFEALYQMGVSA